MTNAIISKAFLRSYASTRIYATLYHKMSRRRVILGGRFSEETLRLIGRKIRYLRVLNQQTTFLLLTLFYLQLDKKFPCVSCNPQVCYWVHKRSPLVPILHQIILVTPSRRICYTQRRLKLM